MTTRERWVVYPLLFLSLGLALRDKIIPPNMQAESIEAETIRCDQLVAGRAESSLLTIAGESGEARIRLLAGANRTGRLEVFGQHGEVLFLAGADGSGQAGVAEVFASGKPQVQLRSSDTGGLVVAMDADPKTMVILGRDGGQHGVFVVLPGMKSALPVTIPLPQVEVNRPKAKGK